jgi:hypothetical protein
MTVLFLLFSPSCPVQSPVQTAACLCFPLPAVLSQLFCPYCPVPAVLSLLSCPRCPVPAVLSQLSCSSSLSSQLSCLQLCILAVMFCTVLAFLFWLSCHGYPVQWFCTSCSGCSVTTVLFQLFCPSSPVSNSVVSGCPVLVVLSRC